MKRGRAENVSRAQVTLPSGVAKIFRRCLVDELEAPEETGLVCNLDLKSRACIQFEKQRASLRSITRSTPR